MLQSARAMLHRFAEAVAAALLAIIFLAFLAQIAFRYFFNWPVGWTSEVSLIAWLWLVLWGAALVLKDQEEIRLDILTEHAGPRIGRVATALGSLAVIVLFVISLPATWSYVSFMKVEKSSYLNLRMDYVYGIYMLFVVAVIVRSGAALVRAMRGRQPKSAEHVSDEPGR
ncbi:MAG: TRAP transporter small permease [Gammaproteobacteria bacterium]|nr:TRAP transporter small permease [Gammaproteobacteria bacterium]MBU1818892.1 TRAP transporter small permease [Gammaproteobacteria bacterium]